MARSFMVPAEQELSLGHALGMQALQDEADAAEAKALQVLQRKEDELIALARMVQQFHEDIKQARIPCNCLADHV